MSLNTALFLVAALGFVAIAVAQVRWLEQDRGAFSRKRRRAAWAFGFLLLLLGLVRYGASGGFDWLLAADEDGSWRMVTIDGQPVAAREFVVGISDRRVVGGLDDCNSWGFEEEDLDKPPTERMIVTTLALCPDDEPARRAYRVITMSDPVPRLRPGGDLELAARGHRAILRRCEWTEVRDRSSRVTRCLVGQS
jgi:hypothetical protein